MNKTINMGFSQQTFNFDLPNEPNLQKEVLAFIDLSIADNDQITLDQVVNHFSIQPDITPITTTLNLINELFRDDKIHLIIDGTKYMSENIKAVLSEPAHSPSDFIRRRKIIAIIKTHFSEPGLWKDVEIIKPEVIDENVLLRAQHLGIKLFNDVGPANQNSLCRSLRRYLRSWKNNLTEFQKIAQTGNYPGTSEIQKGLYLLNKLLSIHDPCKFIETFLNRENRLCDVSSQFAVLKNFYNDQIDVWNILIEAVEGFEPNRMLLAKNPDVKKALETLCSILKDPKPYGMIKEIRSLISIVQAANDPIVKKQIDSAKALAIEKIEKKIGIRADFLNEKNADPDTRNKALFPLQTGKKKIKMASGIENIADYLNEVTDQFDDVIDMLDCHKT